MTKRSSIDREELGGAQDTRGVSKNVLRILSIASALLLAATALVLVAAHHMPILGSTLWPMKATYDGVEFEAFTAVDDIGGRLQIVYLTNTNDKKVRLTVGGTSNVQDHLDVMPGESGQILLWTRNDFHDQISVGEACAVSDSALAVESVRGGLLWRLVEDSGTTWLELDNPSRASMWVEDGGLVLASRGSLTSLMTHPHRLQITPGVHRYEVRVLRRLVSPATGARLDGETELYVNGIRIRKVE